jgi:hypothetical protein
MHALEFASTRSLPAALAHRRQGTALLYFRATPARLTQLLRQTGGTRRSATALSRSVRTVTVEGGAWGGCRWRDGLKLPELRPTTRDRKLAAGGGR